MIIAQPCWSLELKCASRAPKYGEKEAFLYNNLNNL
jgi:hypothetical protein